MSQELTKAQSSKGSVAVIQRDNTRLLVIKLVGSERVIAQSSISEIRIGLGLWYFFGFLRVLKIYVVGDLRPLVLANMRKSKAKQIKELLGF